MMAVPCIVASRSLGLYIYWERSGWLTTVFCNNTKRKVRAVFDCIFKSTVTCHSWCLYACVCCFLFGSVSMLNKHKLHTAGIQRKWIKSKYASFSTLYPYQGKRTRLRPLVLAFLLETLKLFDDHHKNGRKVVWKEGFMGCGGGGWGA